MSLQQHIIELYFVKYLLIAGILLQSTQTILTKPSAGLYDKDFYVTIQNEHTWNKNHITWW